jgi:tetratricopeptide (TPR) repeat protein
VQSAVSFIEELQQLMQHQNWVEIIVRADDISRFAGSVRERAVAFHALGRAHWALSRDACDLAAAVRYARAAVRLDDLHGQSLKTMGWFLVTVGCYDEGTRALNTWLARHHEWSPQVQAGLADVQYNLGYAARYQRRFQQAELWYSAALAGYIQAGNQHWAELTSCALAQVLARQGLPDRARVILDNVTSQEAYRLKALVEIFVAEGNANQALIIGETASAALLALADDDPWELAELHILLADIQSHAGNLAERDQHLSVVMEVLRQSPRHDLYTTARLLLERDREEVG